MRGLFDQERAMSVGVIRTAQRILSLLLLVAGILVVGHSVPNILSASFFTGVLQLTVGLGFLLGIYMIVRLLSETLFAMHRLNDRLTILSDDLRARPETTQASPQSSQTATQPKPSTSQTRPKRATAKAKE